MLQCATWFELDRVIADGDPIRFAQFRASDERVPAVSPVGATSKESGQGEAFRCF